MSIIPTAFQFRFTFPIPRVAGPGKKSSELKLPATAHIPFPSALDGNSEFAELRLGWSPEGLGVSLRVTGRKQTPFADPENLNASDGLWLWLDTRDTQTIHRASRYCHLFVLCPTGDGKQEDEPFVRQLPVPRAKDDAPRIDEDSVLSYAEISKSGYRLDAWFSTGTLHGFDPVSQSRLGFYALIRDSELGQQQLTVGDEFPYEGDPSLWSSLELVESSPR